MSGKGWKSVTIDLQYEITGEIYFNEIFHKGRLK